MRRTELQDELFDPDGRGGYLKIDVLLLPDNTLKGHAWIPEMGRRLVEKKLFRYPTTHTSFAWHLVKEKG